MGGGGWNSRGEEESGRGTSGRGKFENKELPGKRISRGRGTEAVGGEELLRVRIIEGEEQFRARISRGLGTVGRGASRRGRVWGE